MRGVGAYLLVKLVGSGTLHVRADPGGVDRWLGKLAPRPQSGHSVNAGAGVRYQAARIGSPLPGLPHIRLGGRCAASLRCLADRGTIADAVAMRAG
jgi:hypothetical protein